MNPANFMVNKTPANGAKHILNLITLMLANGASDCVYYDGSSVQSGTPSDSSFNGAYCWVCITLADGGQWCFQKYDQYDAYWRVTFSVSGSLAGGSGATAPSSTDRKIMYGGGSEASPTFALLFPSANTYRAQYYVGDETPFGFYAKTYPIGGGDCNSAIYQDRVTSPVTDPHPYVMCCISSGFRQNSGTGVSANYKVVFYLDKDGPNEAFVGGNALFYTGDSGSASTGTNPINGNYDSYPMAYNRGSRYGGTVGFKGYSTLYRWNFTSGMSTPGDGVTPGTDTLSRWNVDDATAIWDGESTPIK